MNIYIAAIIGLVAIIIGLIAYHLWFRRYLSGKLLTEDLENLRDKMAADSHERICRDERYERLVNNIASLKRDYFDLNEMYRKNLNINNDKTITPNHADIYNSINKLRTIVDKSICGILRKVDSIYVCIAQYRGYENTTRTKEQIQIDIPIPELSTILEDTPVILSAITKKLDELTKKIAVKKQDIDLVLTYPAGGI